MRSVWIEQILWLLILFHLTIRFGIVVSLSHCGEFDGNSITTQQRIFLAKHSGIGKTLGFESNLEQLFDGFNQKNPIKMNRALEMLRNVKINESVEFANDLTKTIVSKMIKSEFVIELDVVI